MDKFEELLKRLGATGPEKSVKAKRLSELTGIPTVLLKTYLDSLSRSEESKIMSMEYGSSYYVNSYADNF